MKKYYYCCAYENTYNRGCQIVTAENIEKVAKKWKETNGYENVWVYDIDHEFVAKY